MSGKFVGNENNTQRAHSYSDVRNELLRDYSLLFGEWSFLNGIGWNGHLKMVGMACKYTFGIRIPRSLVIMWSRTRIVVITALRDSLSCYLLGNWVRVNIAKAIEWLCIDKGWVPLTVLCLVGLVSRAKRTNISRTAKKHLHWLAQSPTIELHIGK